jgi:hypothetical protein
MSSTGGTMREAFLFTNTNLTKVIATLFADGEIEIPVGNSKAELEEALTYALKEIHRLKTGPSTYIDLHTSLARHAMLEHYAQGATVWLVGQHKGKDAQWELQGVYLTEREAILSCQERNWFIGPLVIGSPLPPESSEWRGCYYPLS